MSAVASAKLSCSEGLGGEGGPGAPGREVRAPLPNRYLPLSAIAMGEEAWGVRASSGGPGRR